MKYIMRWDFIGDQTMMQCQILWNSLSIEEWESRFDQIKQSNLLQSYAYARAICPMKGQKARWGLILMNNQEAGLVQMIEAGILWNFFHAMMIDRGPLWLPGYGGAAHIKAFFDEINRQFPGRFGRNRRFLPEIEQGKAANDILKNAGFKHRDGWQGYQTIWLDLTNDLEALRQGLKQKWRNMLNKAEKSEIQIIWDREGQDLGWLLKLYQADKRDKGYSGASPQLLANIAKFLPKTSDVIIGKAMKDEHPIAAILIFKHGKAATYQVGWNSSVGRKYAAHHLLLWQVLNVLKEQGVECFDLGGINDQEAEGVKRFKEGLGGVSTQLVGHYS